MERIWLELFFYIDRDLSQQKQELALLQLKKKLASVRHHLLEVDP